MQNIISTIKYLAETNVINFILMAAFLGWVIVKMSVKTSFDNAVNGVKSSIDKSEAEKNNSEVLVKNAQQEIAKLPREIEDIQKFSQQKSDAIKQQIQESTENSIRNINNNVEKYAQIEEKKISNEIIQKTIEDSIETSKDKISEVLKTNPDMHLKFIEESLEELSRIKI